VTFLVARRPRIPEGEVGGFAVAGVAAWVVGTIVYHLTGPIGGTLPALGTTIVVYGVFSAGSAHGRASGSGGPTARGHFKITMTKRWVLSILVASAIAASPSAQERKPVTPADYGKWETLGASVLSRDGRWLAVPMTRVDGTAELCLHRGVQPGSPVDAGAVFKAARPRAGIRRPRRWMAYRLGQSRPTGAAGRKTLRDRSGSSVWTAWPAGVDRNPGGRASRRRPRRSSTG
jgi:hypothetical protein